MRDGDGFVMFMAWNWDGRVPSRSLQPVVFTPAAIRGNVEQAYRP